MTGKKSVVLSDINGSNKKAVLTLQEHENGLDGQMRLYNFSRELDGVSSLGLYVNQKVYKAGLTQVAHMLYRFFIGLDRIPEKFSCAVINFQNAEPTPILFGSSEGSEENIYGEIISELSEDSTISSTQNVLDKYGVGFDEKEEKSVEKNIDKCLCESTNNCANCVYKKHFYENKNHVEKTENEDEKNHQNDKKLVPEAEKLPSFYEKLRPQIEKMFAKNPVEDNLQTLIPDSKWAKVEYEDDGDFFVFGLLYDGHHDVKYVCYGVPAVFDSEPPKELSGFPVWLPLDKEKNEGFGYWLTYQDASTGDPVKVVVE